MNIELSKESEQLIQAMMASHQHRDVSDYVDSLIREDSITRQQLTDAISDQSESFERMAIDGLQSGLAIDVDANYWQQKREALRKRDETRRDA